MDSGSIAKMKPILILKVSLLGSLLLASCSTARGPESDIAFSASGDLETVVIVGTNDIHGGLAPQSLKTRETDDTLSVPYEAGGAAFLADYIRILRNEFGDRLLWLDAGDEFQGTIESNTEQGSSVVRFFNATGLNAAAIGNHEFDFGPNRAPSPGNTAKDVLGSLRARLKEAQFPYLSANLLDKKTGKLPEIQNLYSSKLMTAGRMKVGVIGLTTPETAVTTLPEFVKELVFDNLKKATLREITKLREEGAQSIVLDAHVGIRCSPGKMPVYHLFRKPSDPQGDCERSEELVQLLKDLPSGSVDAVVSGHSHQIVHHWVNGVPVIQGGASARYINLIYLTYDVKNGKLLTDRTRIEGPIPICPKVFQNQNDCNGDRPAPRNGRGPLISPKFHGQAISAEPRITELLKPVFEKAEAAKQEIVAHAARRIEHERFAESPLGDLIADSMRAAVKADVAIMNSGGIRAPFEAGPITFGTVFRTVPFDNSIVVLTLTGRELKTILRISESGSRGYFSVSGVRLRLIGPSYDAPSSDLNGNAKIEPWEVNRVLEVSLEDGRPIDDHQQYTLATLDFLALGGDDYGWFMSQIPKSRIKMTGLITRDAFVKYLRETAVAAGGENFGFNSAEHPLINPEKPRLKFENPHQKSSKRQSSARHKKSRTSKKRR